MAGRQVRAPAAVTFAPMPAAGRIPASNPHRTLRDAVAARRFDPAYYVAGEDEYQKSDAVRQLVEAAVDPATRDFNHDVRSGGEIDGGELLSLVNTPPMMAERRAVVLRDVQLLRKEVRAALERYLEHPASGTLLVLGAAAGAREDRVLERLATPLRFDRLAAERLPRWIAHHASTVHRTEVTDGAAELLASAVGSDLYRLAGELDKLASYTGGGTITEEAVAAVVGVRRGETLEDLLDRVLARDAAGALDLVPLVLQQPRTGAVPVIMALATTMLAVAWGRARLDEGLPPGRLQGEYFGLLRSTGAYTGRPWDAATRSWAGAAPEWSTAACDRALAALLDADVALKESRISSEEQIVATAVLALCAAASSERLAA